MKCEYCGKKVSGNARYCSTYCREKGEALQKQSRATRIPFAIFEILAGIAAFIAVVLIFAEKPDDGFLLLSAALAVSGIGMLAFPRSGKGARSFCQTAGCLFFALAVAIFILWR